jgi:hypothetical protein
LNGCSSSGIGSTDPGTNDAGAGGKPDNATSGGSSSNGGKPAGSAGHSNPGGSSHGGTVANDGGASTEDGGAESGGTNANGGSAGTAGTQTGGTAGSENTAGADTAGADTGGTDTGGTTNIGGTAGTAGTDTGGTNTGGSAGTAGTETGGTAGSDVGGTAGTAGSDVGGTAGTAGSDTGGTAGTAGSDTGGTAGTGGGGGNSSPPICASADEGYVLSLSCPGSSVVQSIVFASYGTPTGECGAFEVSACDSTTSVTEVEAACLGENSCSIDATNDVFDDPCGGTYKHLYVEAQCSDCGNGVVDANETCDDGVNDDVLCSSDCSSQPEVAQIHLHCDAGSEVISSVVGTDCIKVNPGGASYITFSSSDVSVTLYGNDDCTGNSRVVSTDLNFCDYEFDEGGGLNDSVQSVRANHL